jgi:hypothetical protein
VTVLVTADQLVAHAVGDYLLQSHWMATQKTKASVPAIVHAFAYGLPFLLFRPTLLAWLVIVVTHFVIDRWRLARFVVWVKNLVGSRAYARPWRECRATGYPDSEPVWLTVWLLIVADNTLHVLVNAVALRWL